MCVLLNRAGGCSTNSTRLMKVPELGKHWPQAKTWPGYTCHGWPHCYWGFWAVQCSFCRPVSCSFPGIQYSWIPKSVWQVDQLVNIHDHALQIKRVKGMPNIMVLKTLYKQQSPCTAQRRSSFQTRGTLSLLQHPLPPLFSCWMFHSLSSFMAFIHSLSSFSFGAPRWGSYHLLWRCGCLFSDLRTDPFI